MTTALMEQFGIKSFSPSQLIKWAEDKGMWYAKHVAKVKDDAGPAAWRGDAIEAGFYSALMGRPDDEALQKAMDAFDLRLMDWATSHEGEIHDEEADERAKIEPALKRAIAGAKELALPVPTLYQHGVECFPHPRISAKVFGKLDFAFNGTPPYALDLKTTGQMPSAEPKQDHAMAASLYAFARRDEIAKILYVSTAGSPKIGYRLFTLDADMIAAYVGHAASLIAQIHTNLAAAVALSEYEPVSPEQALAELCRPNLLAKGGGTFPLWRDEFTRAALDAVPVWSI
jgi:hypothetical protein